MHAHWVVHTSGSSLGTRTYHQICAYSTAYREFSLTWSCLCLCIIIETKGNFCIRKVFNSRIGLEHQHGRRFIILFHLYSGIEIVWKRSIVGGRKHSKTLVGRAPVLTRNVRVFETNRPYSHVFVDAFYLDIVHVTVLKRFAPLCHWK